MHDNAVIPENINEFINKGINKGKRKKRIQKIKNISGILICLLLTFFIAGIRVSPVMASNIAKIPGLRYIVDLVGFDKGLASALDNDYVQHIDKSDEKLGLALTVKDIIADKSGLIVFYSIENKGSYTSPHISNVSLKDSKGKTLEMSDSFGYAPYEGKIYTGRIDFHSVTEDQFTNGFPETVTLEARIAVDKTEDDKVYSQQIDVPAENTMIGKDSQVVLQDTWRVSMSIDNKKFSQMVKNYKINQSVQVQGQKILFENIKIYPTKSVLSVSFDKENTMKLFTFEDLKLMDENGQEWGKTTSIFTGSLPSENSQTLNFQSNYFSEPKELYITGSSIRALDKDKCYFTLDTEKKAISYSPFNLMSLNQFKLEKATLYFEAEIKKAPDDERSTYEFSNEATDANGNKMDIIEEGMGNSGKVSYMSYVIKIKPDFKGPVTFKIHDYPNRIKGDFKIKIPLEN